MKHFFVCTSSMFFSQIRGDFFLFFTFFFFSFLLFNSIFIKFILYRHTYFYIFHFFQMLDVINNSNVKKMLGTPGQQFSGK